jgi:hypothetical protein
MIIYYRLVYISKEVREEIIKQAHNIITSGHFGIEKKWKGLCESTIG